MASIPKIAPRNPLSAQRQVTPDAGYGFRLMAQAMSEAYDRFAPAATEAMKRRGEEEGREVARAQMGERTFNFGTGNYRDAIAAVESRGSGDYAAVGPETRDGDRAYGRYQVMGNNIGPWTEKYLGRRMTPQEFLSDPAAQDAVFDGEFGSYVQRYGNPQDAASMWFSGRPLAGNTRSDGHIDVPEYVNRFNSALGTPAEVLIRTPGGKVEPRLYSPLSGPILQAYNAAAQVAYQSEVLNRASFDLTDMMNMHVLDPEGFETAAQDYIDQVVENAPETFAPDLRAALENEAHKGLLGIFEAKHRDIRQRASNESGALVERWSDDLARAIQSGNEEEIAAARTNLSSVLAARENLPGISWTRAQSENAIRKAEEAGVRLIEAQRKEANEQIKSDLQLTIKAAKEGMTSANQDVAFSPDAVAAFPDLAAEAQAHLALNDMLPSFYSATPEQRAQVEAEIGAGPVSQDWEIDIRKALEDKNDYITTEWEDRPIETADRYMPTKPPELVPLGPDTADAAIASMVARRDYVNATLVGGGMIEAPVYLSGDEAQSLAAVLAAGVEPEIRAALASSIVSGFGADAGKVFAQIGETDPVLKFAGQLMARTGNSALAVEALRGQQMLKEGQVQLPTKEPRLTAMTDTIGNAFDGLPGDIQARSDVMAFAEALYAAGAQGIQPDSTEAGDLFGRAIQRALGQTDDGNAVRGGIQDIYGSKTLLPPSVSGAALEQALSFAMSGIGTYGELFEAAQSPAGIWDKAGPGTPMLYGQPLEASQFSSGNIRMIPVPGGNGMRYRMEYVNGSTAAPVLDSEGRVYAFDMGELVKAGRRAKVRSPVPAVSTEEREMLDVIESGGFFDRPGMLQRPE